MELCWARGIGSLISSIRMVETIYKASHFLRDDETDLGVI